ncbi:MAG TPA: proprotein convertase P-domain-containing protein, partial [Cryomorphaceae bacterium]|nr:proprotein convertase P-domain-containing protein [Cryomorphaceae bacterium]
MKPIFTTIFSFLLFSTAFSQCPEPEVLDWQFSSPDEVEISVDFPEGAVAYTVTFVALYAGVNGPINDALLFTGDAAPGLQTLTFDPTEIVPTLMEPERYFYQVFIDTECESGGSNTAPPFYVSPLSLRNMPGVQCQQPFTIIEYLADGNGFAVDFDFDVGANDSPETIDDMSVLVDIGHMYNGDLSMTLISPAGTTVQLLDFPNGFGGTSGMSILYADGAPEINDPVGIFSPAEPLSNFNGEMPNGTWTLHVVDNLGMDDGFVFGGCINFNTSPCETSFSGKTYFDLNSNNSEDGDEPVFANALIENSEDETVFFANSYGQYLRCADAGLADLSLASPPAYYSSSPQSHNILLNAGDAAADLDFALVPEGEVVDLHADMFSMGADRPGFYNSYSVNCTNLGNTCQDDVVLELVLDELLAIEDVDGGVASFSDNTATVQLGTLCPMESVTIQVSHWLSDTVSLGTELQSTATLLPTGGDEVTEDNTSDLISIVIGAYDPNDKQVSREVIDSEFLDEEKYLTYHIRFQNTGTFYAENVVVTDTISEYLDFNTFELLDVSHDVELLNDGNQIDFTFDDIFLPDSATDLEGSQGYVRYRIKPKAAFGQTDVITNTAHIFFDFNEAIITNTVSTVFGTVSGVPSTAIQPQVYPNPTSKTLHVTSPALATASRYMVTNLIGQRLKQGILTGGSNDFSIDIENLSPGVYLLHITGEVGFKPVRWV